MNNKIKTLVLFVVLASIGGIYFTVYSPGLNNGNDYEVPTVPIACTMDAKQCPDGSYVGRVGPKCEFQQCPEGATVSESKSVKIGQSVIISGIKVTPIKVVEDSRCPSDVQCVWAGRIVVKTKFEEINAATNVQSEGMEMDVELGKSFDIFGKWGNLEDVSSDKANNLVFKYNIKNYER